MKKIATIFFSLVLVISPVWMSATAVAETVTSDETVDESSVIETEEKTVSSQSSTNSTSSSESSESIVGGSEGSSQEMVDESEKTLVHHVTFLTDAKHNFSSNVTEIKVEKEDTSQLTSEEIPAADQLEDFLGWKIGDELYSTKELQSLKITSDLTIISVFKEVKARSAKLAVNTSIKDVISAADKTKVIVVPDPTDANNAYKEYAASSAGVRSALNDLYQNGAGGDYVLYIGANVSLTGTGIQAKVVPATVDATNATFYALAGKVGTLTITGNSDDPITTDTAVPANSKTLTFGTGTANSVYFGTSVIFRNISYSGAKMYMNGHNLTLTGGSSGNGFSVYGGADNEDITGNPTITLDATGSGTWEFYGGNEAGGTLTGNPSIVINNTTGNIATLSGGAKSGTVKGNITTTVTNTKGYINEIYGAGVGTSAAPANTEGTVNTTIDIKDSASGFLFNKFFGGTLFGNITGPINSRISGYGGFRGTTVRFTGGSGTGDIGTDASKDVITSLLDISLYSGTLDQFEGANNISGTIKGNITNTVTAGPTASNGGINFFNGGAGESASRLTQSTMGASNLTTYDAYTPEQRQQLAEDAAKFKLYGNIYTKVTKGSIGNGTGYYVTAAGRAGYIEGNTTIELGTYKGDGTVGGEGLVYRGSKPANTDYSNSSNSRPYPVPLDIVGAGGNVGVRYPIYIKGNTKTIQNNTFARWTYGGGFSGVVEGNTSNVMNAGLVDTLEGGGFETDRIFGDTHATVMNGQVDWFLSGGGWSDSKIVGNVGVEVYDGVINASMGGTYGVGSHLVTGNSDNYVYGGDFSGRTRYGNNGFSGGVTNSGTIAGNANLTIDLRNYDGDFKLPTGTSVTGGRPAGVNTNLGTDENNTITLNIYAKPGVDSLAGANIYGDGGTNATNTKSGKIIMNIQADGSTIGNLYATQYSNLSNSKILRDVEVNLQGAKSINGLSGGNQSDNFTNAIVAASTNKSVFTIGKNVDGLGVYQKEPINSSGIGVLNFTSMNITNGLKLMASGGNVKNGSSATAANHGTTYNEFGDVHLSKGGGLGISTTTGLISIGKLTVEDEGTVESPPGTGKINISDFETPDESKDRLTWIATSPAASAMVASNGTWFGSTKAFQVLTVNPTIKNAESIKPMNFTGYDKTTGKTYIGDNDVTKAGSGYGIALPGSFIDYEVETPGIADGDGTISHDVTQVKENNLPLTLGAWGTEVAGKSVKKGRLVIPTERGIFPTLTFTPETQTTGSWVYSGSIVSTKIGSTDEVIDEQPNSDAVDWTSPDGEYSYTVKVKYSNKAELSANNVFITEQEASQITSKTDVNKYVSVTGRPFLNDDNITEALLEEIRQPLAIDEVSRAHKISYSSGITDANKVKETYNLIVVRDDSSISSDRSTAIYAKSARFLLEEANALVDDTDLNTHTLAQVLFADGRVSEKPTIDTNAFDSIKNTQQSELVKNVSTKYSYSNGTISIEKVVNVMIAGELKVVEIPSDVNFGNQMVSNRLKTYWPSIVGNLTVQDTRGSERDDWQMTVVETSPLTSGTTTLEETMYFSDGVADRQLGPNAVIVEDTTLQQDGQFVISDQWGETKDKGLKLKVPADKQRLGNYEGTLTWTLVSGPGN